MKVNNCLNVLSLTKFERKRVREELIDPEHIHVNLGHVHAIDICYHS